MEHGGESESRRRNSTSFHGAPGDAALRTASLWKEGTPPEGHVVMSDGQQDDDWSWGPYPEDDDIFSPAASPGTTTSPRSAPVLTPVAAVLPDVDGVDPEEGTSYEQPQPRAPPDDLDGPAKRCFEPQVLRYPDGSLYCGLPSG